LTDAEAVDVDALIAEAKSINQMLAADDRHRGTSWLPLTRRRRRRRVVCRVTVDD
jgi:hypothetical protein